MPRFRIANIVRDREILEQAHKIAFQIIAEDYDLELERHKLIKEKYQKEFLKRERLFSF